MNEAQPYAWPLALPSPPNTGKRVLITGANGFLGRHVVAEALRRGRRVRAVVRSRVEAAHHAWAADANVELAEADLRAKRGLAEVVRGADCVIHLAAAKSGDMYAQYAGTVVATENLLAAMTEAGVRRIVAVSSLSVYDYREIANFDTLDENSPVEANAFERDEYAHTKLVQERLIREHAAAHGWDWTVLRPGVIWGRGNLWTARLGVQAGRRVWVRTGGAARLPLTYVENCAEAVVLAAEDPLAQGQVFNVIDDEQPTQRAYAKLLKARTRPEPVILPVPLTVMRAIATSADWTNRLLLKRRAKIPGLFVPARLEARCRPLAFANQKIKSFLGWSPRYGLGEALRRSTMEPAA
jgi:nucleoside-diphosphate-sugar epimerase